MDLGPVEIDLEGPGLAHDVDLGPSCVVAAEVGAGCTGCFRLFDG